MVAQEFPGGPGLHLPLAVRPGVLRRRPHAADIQRALKLAPDDPEVLLTAAIASEQKQDAAAARRYWEKGLQARSQERRARPGPGPPGDSGKPPRSGRGRPAASVPGQSRSRPGFRAGRNADPPGQDRGEGPGRRLHRPAPHRRVGRHLRPLSRGKNPVSAEDSGPRRSAGSKWPGRRWRPIRGSPPCST